MAFDKSEWSIPLGKMAEVAEEELSTVARIAVFELMRAVVMRSPVDTGAFAASWMYSVNSPATGTRDDELDPRLEDAKERVEEALKLKMGDTAYLVNNLPYAIPLENGHSGQAPQGMVKLSVKEYGQHVKTAIAKANSQK